MTKYNKLVISRIFQFMSIVQLVAFISFYFTLFDFRTSERIKWSAQKPTSKSIKPRLRGRHQKWQNHNQWYNMNESHIILSFELRKRYNKKIPPLTWTDLLHHTQFAAGYAHRTLIDLFILHYRYKTLIICVCALFSVRLTWLVHAERFPQVMPTISERTNIIPNERKNWIKNYVFFLSVLFSYFTTL